MSLETRDGCERCGTVLVGDGPAFICSYECTFCGGCAVGIKHTCPNCGGEPVVRPRHEVGAV